MGGEKLQPVNDIDVLEQVLLTTAINSEDPLARQNGPEEILSGQSETTLIWENCIKLETDKPDLIIATIRVDSAAHGKDTDQSNKQDAG
jgi:hypothetical protein